MDVDPSGATWRKSTYSNGSGGNCVEVADLPNGRAVRDSKHPEGPILVFAREGWQAFVQGIQAGELCAELEPGQAAGICRESPGHDPSLFERVGGSPTRTVVCYACTEWSQQRIDRSRRREPTRTIDRPAA
jgi:hypothetical protein